jgi:hypothetical protein
MMTMRAILTASRQTQSRMPLEHGMARKNEGASIPCADQKFSACRGHVVHA